MKLRMIALLLAVLTIFPVLASCKKDDEDTGPSLSLLQDGACTVVFDEDTTTTKVLNRVVEAIEAAAGIKVSTARKPTEGGTQILLGKVDCEDGKAATDGLRLLEYTVGVYGSSYVISGFDASSTASAANYFIDKVLPTCAENDWVVWGSDNFTLTKDYQLTGVTIGGEELKKFTICIPSNYTPSEYRTALALQDHLSGMAGYPLEIVTAKKTAQIRIGKSICTTAKATDPHSWKVTCSGSIMEIVAECDFGYQALISEDIANEVFNYRKELRAYTDSTVLEGDGNNMSQIPLAKEGDVRLLFNNIHGNANYTEFPVEPCNQMLSDMYKEFLPDVLGLQECSAESRNGGIVNLLKPTFTEVAASTGDNVNNSTPLFYRADTLQLMKSGFYRFNSMTYSEYSSLLGGQSASAVKSRAADSSKSFTWAIFKVKATGEVFMVASVHLWWKNDNTLDETARTIQIAKLKDELTKQAQSYATSKSISMIPIFVGGDYNCHANMSSFYSMGATGTGNDFTDMNNLAPADKKVTTSTHHGYATYNKDLGVYEKPQKVTGKYTSALDYIFTNTGKAGNTFTVDGMGISIDEPCLLSTDHCPIYADISFTANAPKIN